MKNQSLKCSQIVRDIPLERYRLPEDGRKWKQAARHRSDVLFRLSSYANNDGTFVRNGINYSPRFKKLEKHIARKSFFRITDALHTTGLLSWTRDNHYDCRIYTIHLSEITGATFTPNQVPDSEITGATLDDHTQNQVPHSPKTGVTMGHDPSSVPSFKEPSREREPSTAAQKPNRSPSLEDSSKPAQDKTPEQEKTKAAQDKRKREMINTIIEHAKARSKGKAGFSKTARGDLAIALIDLGPVTMDEIDTALSAELDQCSDDDPTSYVVFGSRFAATLVSSIRSKRQRDAAYVDKVEKRRLGDEWCAAFHAAEDDLTIDLSDWVDDNPPRGHARNIVVALLQTAIQDREYRQRQNAESATAEI